MLNPKIQDALNQQLNAELSSSYLYLSMSAYFQSTSFVGMANWMRLQSQEEMGHALKIYDFINNRNGRVTLTQIEAPKIQWNGPLDAFEDTLAHEQKITGSINQLDDLAVTEKDHATVAFLEWFVTEQVEEEASVSTVIDQLKLVGDDGGALFMLDGQLAGRSAASSEA